MDAVLLLLDTDVLIDYLHERPDAISFVQGSPDPMVVSVVTVAELYAGARDEAEKLEIEEFLLVFELIPVTREIAERGGALKHDYCKSHGVQLPDALIAATAGLIGAALVTLNTKHFPMLQNVIVPYRKST